ncbi:MAG: (deoxy)nucleoside triphosphate pyrophosphohydrolase [Acidobacteria bacterium]|nr:(deoxy)nucleoside triphosphate pyrophosphohydrolase [Acidobacteriota bacterium]MDA1233512.1 (deoxy)nucleoside triphosphate pyrophosphohydrolase [Acidobacteriota bacterium]
MLTVVAGLLVSDGRILACRRRSDQDHASKWEFPGGKVEPGEDPRDALVRELREELRIEATLGDEFMRYEFGYAGKEPIELIFYWVETYDGALNDEFFAETKWVVPGGLVSLDFLEGDARVVAELASRPLG